MTPKTEWLVIVAEEPNTAEILKGYVLPQDKVVGYLVVSIIILIVTYWIISLILTSIVFSIFGLSATSMMRNL